MSAAAMQREEEGEEASLTSLTAARKLEVNGREFSYYRAVSQRKPRLSIFCLPVLDPAGTAAVAWAVAMTVLDLTYTAFLVPAAVAFTDTNFHASFLSIVTAVGNVLYITDLLAGFHVGFAATWDARFVTITDGPLTAWFYVRHGQFTINFLATLPLILQLVLLAWPGENSTLQLLYLLRLLRIVRVLGVIKALSQPGGRGVMGRFVAGRFSSVHMLIFQAVLSLLVLLNLLGCVWWAVAVAEGIENSWAGQISKASDLANASNWTRWLVSIYFVMTTMTTIGYGDVTPYTDAEMAISLLYMIIGALFFGYIIGVVSELLHASQPSRAAAALHERLQGLDAWMEGRRLPAATQRKLRGFFLTKWMHESVSDEGAEFYQQLPPDLKALARRSMQSAALTRSVFFSDVSAEARHVLTSVLSGLAVPMSVFPGHVLYRKGDPATYMYILDEGTMTASSGTAWRPTAFEGPALVGTVAIFARAVPELATRAQTVTAVTACHLWRLEAGEAEELLHGHRVQVFQELVQLRLERLHGLLAQCQQQGWGDPEALPRQQQALARMQRVVAGLEQLSAELVAEAADHERRQQEEESILRLLTASSGAGSLGGLSVLGEESLSLPAEPAKEGGRRGALARLLHPHAAPAAAAARSSLAAADVEQGGSKSLQLAEDWGGSNGSGGGGRTLQRGGLSGGGSLAGAPEEVKELVRQLELADILQGEPGKA